MNRRPHPTLTFLIILAILVGGVSSGVWAQTSQVPLPGSSIPQWVNQLPTLTGPGGATKPNMESVLAPSSDASNPTTLFMKELLVPVLPATTPFAVGTNYNGTSVFSYRLDESATTADTYIGPVFVANRGTPTAVKYINNLGATTTTEVPLWKFSVDQTLHWANPNNLPMMDPQAMMPYAGPIPAVPHLHGGEVPAAIDGGPDAWFLSDPAGWGTGYPAAWDSYSQHGPGYYTLSGSGTNNALYRYPNSQEAGPLWFHDHLLGGTRINVYAGLAGAYLLTDPALVLPAGMTATGLLNGPPATPRGPATTELTIPLVLQDRMFDNKGQLYFPDAGLNPAIHPFWIPEFVGDTIVVNGKAWPNLNVEAKRYSFLIINGSNARFYELSIFGTGSSQHGPFSGPRYVVDRNPPMYVIGTDGGYLDRAVPVSKLLIGPGERYQVIIDFGNFAGNALIMTNTARTPFPNGTPPDSSTLGRIVRFTVGRVTSFTGADRSYNPAVTPTIRTGSQVIQRLVKPATGTLNVTSARTRQLTLNEVMGMGGPLEILVNNTKWNGMRPDMATPVNGATVTDRAGNYLTELPKEGTTEVWEIINLTADAHPIHLHLVQFQILNRQNFNLNNYLNLYNASFPGGSGIDMMTGMEMTYPAGVYTPAFGPPADYNTGKTFNPGSGLYDGPAITTFLGGNPDVTPFLQGKPAPPDPNEAGWKDTAIMHPGQVTRIAVRFAPTDTAPGVTAYYPFVPNPDNYSFVWHCHIVDHEDNEMMRPYQVDSTGVITTRTYVNTGGNPDY